MSTIKEEVIALIQQMPETSNISDYHTSNRASLISLGFGASLLDTNRTYKNQLMFENEYLLFSAEDIAELMTFFNSKYGQARSFCLPSFKADLTLTNDAASGQNQIVVDDNETGIAVGTNLFFMQDAHGTYFTHKITAIDENTITLDGNLSDDLLADTTVSIIYRVRYAEDFLKLNYQTDNVAKVVMLFVEEIRTSDTDQTVTTEDEC